MNDSDRKRLGQPLAPQSPAPYTPLFRPGQGLRVTGWVVLALGAAAVVGGLLVRVTVHIGPDYGGDEVINSSLVQMQNVLLMCGLALLLLGGLFYVGGKIVGAIYEGREKRGH